MVLKREEVLTTEQTAEKNDSMVSLAAGHCLKNIPCKVKRTDASFLAELPGVNVNNQVKLLSFNAV